MKFFSRYREHRIGLIPKRYMIDQMQRRVLIPGKEAKFMDNVFETQDQEVIDLLKAHPDYNIDFRAEGDTTPMNEETKQRVAAIQESAENTLTSCPFCTYNARSAFGLRSHIRSKHPGQTES